MCSGLKNVAIVDNLKYYKLYKVLDIVYNTNFDLYRVPYSTYSITFENIYLYFSIINTFKLLCEICRLNFMHKYLSSKSYFEWSIFNHQVFNFAYLYEHKLCVIYRYTVFPMFIKRWNTRYHLLVCQTQL